MFIQDKYLNLLIGGSLVLVILAAIVLVGNFYSTKEKDDGPVGPQTFEFEGREYGIDSGGVNFADKNQDVCEKIQDPTEQQHCNFFFGAIRGEIGMCDPLEEGDMKDTCYISFAKEYFSVDFCEKVSSPENKEVCLQHANRLNQ